MADESSGGGIGAFLSSMMHGAANIFGEVRARRAAEKSQRDAVITQLALQAGASDPSLLSDPAFKKSIDATLGKGAIEFVAPFLSAIGKGSAGKKALQGAAESELLAPNPLPEGQVGPPSPATPTQIMERAKANPAAAELVSPGLGGILLGLKKSGAGRSVIREVKDGDRVRTVQFTTDENGQTQITPIFDAPRQLAKNGSFKTTTNNLALLQAGLTPDQIAAGEITPKQAKSAQDIVKSRETALKRMAISVAAKMKRKEALTEEESQLFGGLDEADVRKIALGGESLQEALAKIMLGEVDMSGTASSATGGTVPAPTPPIKVLNFTPVQDKPAAKKPPADPAMKPMKAEP